jgi:hypothetical protein
LHGRDLFVLSSGHLQLSQDLVSFDSKQNVSARDTALFSICKAYYHFDFLRYPVLVNISGGILSASSLVEGKKVEHARINHQYLRIIGLLLPYDRLFRESDLLKLLFSDAALQRDVITDISERGVPGSDMSIEITRLGGRTTHVNPWSTLNLVPLTCCSGLGSELRQRDKSLNPHYRNCTTGSEEI